MVPSDIYDKIVRIDGASFFNDNHIHSFVMILFHLKLAVEIEGQQVTYITKCFVICTLSRDLFK